MDARTTWPALLSALIRGDSLTADESEWAMNEIMEGAATPSQIAGFGVALRIKGTSVAEMTGWPGDAGTPPPSTCRSADRP
jgi:anthranilate phosphoribosyltransferase